MEQLESVDVVVLVAEVLLEQLVHSVLQQSGGAVRSLTWVLEVPTRLVTADSGLVY